MLEQKRHKDSIGLTLITSALSKFKSKVYLSLKFSGIIALISATYFFLDAEFFIQLKEELPKVLRNLVSMALHKELETIKYDFTNGIQNWFTGFSTIFISSSFLVYSGLTFMDKIVGKEKKIRGNKLVSPKELKQEIENYHLDWVFKPSDEKFRKLNPMDFLELGYSSKEDRYRQLYGKYLEIGKFRERIIIPEELFYLMFAISGSTGTGKSQLLEQVIPQIIEMGCGGLIVDYNGEFYRKFGKPEDKVVSLYDVRKENWSFWNEEMTPEDVSKVLIADSPNDEFFAPAARTVFNYLLTTFTNIEDAKKAIKLATVDDLKEICKGSEAAKYFEAHNTAGGIISTMSIQLSVIEHLGLWTEGKPKFSIRKSALTGNDFIYLIVHQREKERMKPWIKLWTSIYLDGILDRKENQEYNTSFLFVDEAPLIGDLPSIKEALTNGRKFRLSCWLAWQDIGQMEAIHQQHVRSFKSCIRSTFYFNPNHEQAAEEISKEIGEEEFEEFSYTEVLNGTKFTQENIQRNTVNRTIISKEQVQKLDKLQCIAKLATLPPTILKLSPSRAKVVNQSNLSKYPSGTFLNEEQL